MQNVTIVEASGHILRFVDYKTVDICPEEFVVYQPASTMHG